MLTYQIAPYKATPSPRSNNPASYLQKESILKRQLTRCTFKLGDNVTIQTNKGRKHGVIDDFILDHKECEWHNGTQPFFISVRVPVSPRMAEIFHVPLKKVKVMK